MAPSSSPQSPTGLDAAGAVCGTVCAAHCATTALAPALLAALGIGSTISAGFEWGATALAVAFGLIVLISDRGKQRPTWITATLIFGVVGLTAGRLLEVAEIEAVGPGLSIAAGLSLAAGHIGRLVLARRG